MVALSIYVYGHESGGSENKFSYTLDEADAKETLG
jgi:hypothetical protein